MLLWWVLIIVAVLMLTGLVGTFFPGIPGLPLMWIGILIAGWSDGFSSISLLFVVGTGIFTAVVLVAQQLMTLAGAKYMGASGYGVAGAAIGGIAGLIIGSLPGLIVGSFLGAVLLEIMRGKDILKATRAGFGSLLGFLAGSVLQTVVGVILCISFVFALF